MIYVIGDLHGELEIGKLSRKNFPEGVVAVDDFVVVCGDFGLFWSSPVSSSERYWLDWLDERPWTTLFVDGNHENFDLLNALPREERFGGIVGRAGSRIFHLRRGEVYDVDGFRCFAFGGAESCDKKGRKLGKSLWKEEIPSEEEFSLGMKNLEKQGFEVDLVFSHTAPEVVFRRMDNAGILYTVPNENGDPTRIMLERFLGKLKFSRWYFGHFHEDAGPFQIPNIDGSFFCVYDKKRVEKRPR